MFESAVMGSVSFEKSTDDVDDFDPARRPEEYDHYLRAYNDGSTWLAETLDGSMRTPFEYEFDGRELYAEDGSPLKPIFEAAILDADRLQQNNPALSFEVRRRQIERGEYDDMLAMMRGDGPNTMVVVSDFPPELSSSAKDVGGYNVARQQTMLRVLTRQGNRLRMYSQSLDGSDREALEAIYARFGLRPQPGELLGQRIRVDLAHTEQDCLTDRLTGMYDRNLAARYGGQWHAGRQEATYDTYAFVCQQHDLVDRYAVHVLQGGISAQERYNIAALMARRYEYFKNPVYDVTPQHVVMGAFIQNLDWQLQQAGEAAREQGRTFSGCGVSAPAGNSSAIDQLGESGYGNKTVSQNKDCDFVSKKCPVCGEKDAKTKVKNGTYHHVGKNCKG